MEIIKKIKEAESQAKQVIEQAKTDASKRNEQFRLNRKDALAKAEKERNKIVEDKVHKAEEQGKVELETLQQEAKQKLDKLQQQVSPKIDQAVKKIIKHLQD